MVAPEPLTRPARPPLRIYISSEPSQHSTCSALIDILRPLEWGGQVQLLGSAHEDVLATAAMDGTGAQQTLLEQADLILVLVDRSYVVHGRAEFERVLARSRQAEVHVVPVILAACAWRATPLGHHVPLPRDGRPLERRDADFSDVAVGLILSELELLIEERSSPPSPAELVILSAEADHAVAQALRGQLAAAERTGGVVVWESWQLQVGAEKQRALAERIDQAQLVVLLLSPAFFQAEDCWQGAQRARARAEAGHLRLEPIEVAPVFANPFPDPNKRAVEDWLRRAENLVANLGDLPPRAVLARLLPDAKMAQAEDAAELAVLLGEPRFDLERTGIEQLQEWLTHSTWQDRAATEALLRACEVPGPIAAFPLDLRCKHPELVNEVERALRRLRAPLQHHAGQLAADILFLRRCAQEQPYLSSPERGEIALRQELPGLLLEVLESALALPTNSGDDETLAHAETELYALCMRVVGALPDGTNPRIGRLGFRLFQWLWDRLVGLPPAQRRQALALLRAHWRRMTSGSELRLAALLMALHENAGVTSEYSPVVDGEKLHLWSPATPGILSHVQDLAGTFQDPGFSAYLKTILWYLPATNLSALAMKTLLSLQPEGFTRLPPVVQGEWIAWAAHFSDASELIALLGLAKKPEWVDPAWDDSDAQSTMKSLADRLFADTGQPPEVRNAACGVLLVRDPDRWRDEPQTRSHVFGNLADAELFSTYLLTVGARDPDQMRQDLKVALSKSDDQQILSVLTAAARVVNLGEPVQRAEAVQAVVQFSSDTGRSPVAVRQFLNRFNQP